jgi:RNA polymerase-binding transcription factor DksA
MPTQYSDGNLSIMRCGMRWTITIEWRTFGKCMDCGREIQPAPYCLDDQQRHDAEQSLR